MTTKQKYVLLIIALIGLGVGMLLATVLHAEEVVPSKVFAPQYAIGLGTYSPADLGYIRAWKGIDAKSYVWGQIGNPVWKGVGATLRVEQVIQRLPNGTRPNMAARVEVGWKF